jgi:hypothetical protein
VQLGVSVGAYRQKASELIGAVKYQINRESIHQTIV